MQEIKLEQAKPRKLKTEQRTADIFIYERDLSPENACHEDYPIIEIGMSVNANGRIIYFSSFTLPTSLDKAKEEIRKYGRLIGDCLLREVFSDYGYRLHVNKLFDSNPPKNLPKVSRLELLLGQFKEGMLESLGPQQFLNNFSSLEQPKEMLVPELVSVQKTNQSGKPESRDRPCTYSPGGINEKKSSY